MTYHIIYKTTHVNGKYYIGRHSTEKLEDGYLGSGKWPRSIVDKTQLSREILEYAETPEALILLEGVYLENHYQQPNCMNFTKDPIGFMSGADSHMRIPEIAAKISGDNHWTHRHPERIISGDAHWMNANPTAKAQFIATHPNKDGEVSRKTSEDGNNIFQTNNPSIWRSEQGIHHWQNGNSPNEAGKQNKRLVEEGTHNFLGPDTNNKRIAEGNHNLTGSSANEAMLAAGTHPSQQKKTCEYCSKISSIGMYKRWHGDNCKLKPLG